MAVLAAERKRGRRAALYCDNPTLHYTYSGLCLEVRQGLAQTSI
jgi:hypothetical protein